MNSNTEKYLRLRRWTFVGAFIGVAVNGVAFLLATNGSLILFGSALFVGSVFAGVFLTFMAMAGYPDVRAPAWLWGLPFVGAIGFLVGAYLGALKIAWLLGGGTFLVGLGLIAVTSWLRHS